MTTVQLEKHLNEIKQKIEFFQKLANTDKDILAKATLEFLKQYLIKKYEQKKQNKKNSSNI